MHLLSKQPSAGPVRSAVRQPHLGNPTYIQTAREREGVLLRTHRAGGPQDWVLLRGAVRRFFRQ